MDSPLFRNYCNAPRPRFSTIPVQQQQGKPPHPPKIVSIPVRFVESEKTRSEAATKIQKLFRGFAVRKNVKKIAKIRSEVVEVERRISQKETKERIARDANERLRLNETLMSLLFRLDSVRGIDSAVRDCRKAVIRRAIALQEAIDAITEQQETQTATDLADSSGNSAPDSVDRTLETDAPAQFVADVNVEARSPAVDEQTSEIQHQARISDDCGNLSVNVDDRAQETRFPTEFRDNQDQECVNDPSESLAIDDCGNPSVDREMVQDPSRSVAAVGECRNETVAINDQALEVESADKSKEEKSAGFLVSLQEECQDPSESVAIDDCGNPSVDQEMVQDPSGSVAAVGDSRNVSVAVDDQALEIESADKSKEEKSAAVLVSAHEECQGPSESVAIDDCRNTFGDVDDQAQEMVQDPTGSAAGSVAVDDEAVEIESAEKGGEEEGREEVVENEKLRSMVMELRERNEEQSRMIGALWERVERLEGTVERMRRKKKRGHAGGCERRKCERRL